MVSTINIHSREISTRASPILWKLKNRKLQQKFKKSWMKKSHKAFDLYNEAGFFQIIEREMPIKIYNRVHTGANIQLGGLKEGLFSCAYPADAGGRCEP